jgi:hypothetical protein
MSRKNGSTGSLDFFLHLYCLRGMIYRKGLNQFLLMLMLAMQIALAQHATVHFMDGTHNTPVHQQQDPEPDKDKLCQLCLLSKHFTKILTPAGLDIPAPVDTFSQKAAFLQSIITSGNTSPYIARAPPIFSA